MPTAHFPTYNELSAQFGPAEANRIIAERRPVETAYWEALTAEFVAEGFAPTERVARCAVSHLRAFPNAPDHGLGGMENGALAAEARVAIRAYRAAQAQQVAA